MTERAKNSTLFIHSGGLGDLVLLEPSLRALKKSLGPNSKLDLLVEKRAFKGSQEFFLTNKLVNEVKVFDFKGKRNPLDVFKLLKLISGYSTIISSGSSPIIAILLWLSGSQRRIGFKSKFSFLLTDKVQLNKNQYAACMLHNLVEPISGKADQSAVLPQMNLQNNACPVEELSNRRYFLIHPGVSELSNIKRIEKTPGSSFWKKLLLELCEKYSETSIALIAGPDEKEKIKDISSNIESPNFVDLSNQNFSIQELGSLIKQSSCFICADSAPLHIAVAVNAKIVSIFGPTDPQKIVPERKNIKVAKVDNLLCQPCLWNRRNNSCELPLCIKLLETESIINLVDEFTVSSQK
ncbi:MAG: glycosyltransferase family 9 protein [Candidatus Caenarcaniphilales bacterium]|nr:glycosyltransferase family 9 protein [Candidatus Caenarcaniphilales bacterium]